MPPISGGNHDRVDVGSGEHLIHIAGLDAVLVAVMPVGHDANDFAPRLLHVRDHHELHLGLTEKRLQDLAAPRAETDAAHHDPIAGRHGAIAAKRRSRNERGHAQNHCRCFQKLSSGKFHKKSKSDQTRGAGKISQRADTNWGRGLTGRDFQESENFEQGAGGDSCQRPVSAE